MLGKFETLNTWLDERSRRFHSMERTLATPRTVESRVKPVSCERTFDAVRDEDEDELIRCLS